MARTLIRNITGMPLTLPLPYGGVLAGGAATVVPEDEQTVIQYLGGDDQMRFIWDVFPVNENTLLGPITITDTGVMGVRRALMQSPLPVYINHQRLRFLGTPLVADDATTKAYVDAADATKVPATRRINTGSGLTGGGDLSHDLTILLPAPGPAGNVLTSDGAGVWASAPGGGGGISAVQAGVGIYVNTANPSTPIVSIGPAPGAAGNVLTSDGAGAWTSLPQAGGGVFPQRPAAWGTEHLWWRLDDAPQSGGSPNIAANSGSAGFAPLTATTNPPSNNSNGGAFYDKTPIFGASGPFSAVARFRGSYNTLRGDDSIYNGATAFTLSAWVNISESGGAFTCNVITKKHPSGYSVGILTLAGRAYYLVRANSGEIAYYTATNVLTYGLPNMLAMTYDGSVIRGYLNGQEVVSGAQIGPIVWASGAGSEWEVGQISGGIERYDIWDVRAAPSIRSAAQLLADYKTGMGFSY